MIDAYSNNRQNGVSYINNNMNHSNSLNNSFNPNPYGITFDNEKDYKRNERNKYKEDLDYLIWLKQGRKEGEYNQKAKENWEWKVKLEQQKQMYDSKFNENKKHQYDLLNIQKNLLLNNENRKKLEKDDERYRDIQNLETMSKLGQGQEYLNKEKKDKWNRIANDEYSNYLQKQQDRNWQKAQEDELCLKGQDEKNRIELMRQEEYKMMMNNKNNQIYKNLINYSGYLNNNNLQSNNEPFHLMNDSQLNRYIANQKERERLALRKDSTGKKEFDDLKAVMSEEDKFNKEKKFNSQKAYKEFLDKQYHELQNQKNPIKEPFSGDILPSYKYPSLPIPLYKKAKDSIHLVKNNILFENQNVNMKDFFTNDIQNYTMMDQHDKRFNFNNESSLNDNPIVNPIDRFEFNKYMAENIRSEKNGLSSNKSLNTLKNSYNPKSKAYQGHFHSSRDGPSMSQSVNLEGYKIGSLNQNNNLNNNINSNYDRNTLEPRNQIHKDINNYFSFNNNVKATSQNQPQMYSQSNDNYYSHNDKRIRTPHNNMNYSNENDNYSQNYYYNPQNAEIAKQQSISNQNNDVNYNFLNQVNLPIENYNQNSQNINNNNTSNNSNNYIVEPSNYNNFQLKSQNLNSNTRLMSNSKEDKLIRKFRDRLKVKGILGVYKLRQFFENADKSNTFMIDINNFMQMSKEFYMGFNSDDTRALFEYLDDARIGKIRYEEFLAAIVGDMPEERKQLVVDLYTRLSSVFQDKYVEEQTIKSKFDAQLHPDVLSLKKNYNDALVSFMNDFNLYFHKTRVS